MKLLCIHAHFDDFEFVAAGTFELCRQKLGQRVKAKVVVCTDGAAGHHSRPRAETARMRLREQMASARIGGYEFEPLRLPDGRRPREACAQLTTGFYAALWKVIRDFEPDYIFCPPLPTDSLIGVHPDHINVAEAVRRVAYMINVPHAFTPEYPADERRSVPCKTPVILHVHDSYMAGERPFDLAIEVEPAFEKIAAMLWCHQSQIAEWMPWVGRHNLQAPRSIEDWEGRLRARFKWNNRQHGIRSSRAFEVFTVTAWGVVPEYETLLQDFPGLSRSHSHLAQLRRRLQRWQRAGF
ncbi:MAG: PIG-L deacetylase family protein [Opitutaceae bacterium]